MAVEGDAGPLRRSDRLRRLRFGVVAGLCCCWLALPLAAQSSGGGSARYRLTFEGTWTLAATPGGVHRNAHFSPLIGAVHNDQVSFWRPGGRASPELERVAELGIQDRLAALMGRSPHVHAVFEKEPDRGGTARTTIEFEATRDDPLVTLVTMIAPSPDWFVGVSGLSLLDGQGTWLTSSSVDLFPYDAGTEEGTGFSLNNPPTVPQERIASIRGMGPFTDAPMAKLNFELLEADGTAGFEGDVAAEPVADDAVVVSWAGEWAEPDRGTIDIEARGQKAGWMLLRTVDASDGMVRIDGLETGAPYTFRLRAEAAGGELVYSEEASATTGAYNGPCRGGDQFLCLRDRRFEVQVHWNNAERVGDYGIGRSVPVAVSDESGLFWFFNSANIELVVKVLDGREINGSHWVFFGALSDVEYWITVRDVATGARRTYHNSQGRICGQNDTGAFTGAGGSQAAAWVPPKGSAGLAGQDLLRFEARPVHSAEVKRSVHGDGHCEPSEERLCVLENRFAVEVRFVDPKLSDPDVEPEIAARVASSLTTAETGFFWFFNQENIELAAKVLDGQALNGRFWLLYGGVSDVEYTLTVTDTATGLSRNYRNEQGSICGEVDIEAF